jgi:hypothetical protein
MRLLWRAADAKANRCPTCDLGGSERTDVQLCWETYLDLPVPEVVSGKSIAPAVSVIGATDSRRPVPRRAKSPTCLAGLPVPNCGRGIEVPRDERQEEKAGKVLGDREALPNDIGKK